MKSRALLAVIGGLPWIALAENPRPAVNDLKAPAGRHDLEAISRALAEALPKARAATVGIEAGDGLGSGVIVSADGLILTAAHVTKGVNRKVTVVLDDGTRLPGESLGLLADKDAAMVRIIRPRGPLAFVAIDRQSPARLGDWVFALGHPGGFNPERGAVLRLGRVVKTADGVLQSDCALAKGDSGGPLFDLAGRLVAIHSRAGAPQQMNLHVPVAEVLANWDGLVAAEFIGRGPYAEKPVKGSGFLGLATEDVPGGGLRVLKVGGGSPAEDAGFREGDVVMKLNNVALGNRTRLQEMLAEMAAGDPISLEFQRDGKVRVQTLNLGER